MTYASASPRPVRAARSIVLVGMMGAGKSTVGRRLAARLKRPFADADDAIEAAAGMTIAEIFERYGEAHFRDGERRVIARLLSGPPLVLATGGGAFAQDDTRAEILAHAIAIWIDVPVPVLVDRVSRRDHRPLLHGKDARVVIEDLLAKRGAAYAQAQLHIVSDRGPHERTVDAIIAALRESGEIG
ncbi:MAG: shikimate kinase [Sphingomonas sp.]